MVFKELYRIWTKDDLLDESLKNIDVMFRDNKAMFVIAIKSLIANERNIKEIRAKEKKIDKYTQETRKKILEYLAINSSSELNAALVLASILIDLERLGDISEDIIDLDMKYLKKLKRDEHVSNLMAIEEEILQMFDLTREAFMESDREKAKKILELNKEIQKNCDEEFKKLWERKTCDQTTILLTLVVRYLCRISGHLKNIASSVVNPFHKIGFNGINSRHNHT